MHLKDSYLDFEDTVKKLLSMVKKGPVTLESILVLLSGRARVLLMIFLSLAFGQIPGVSMVLGLFIAYLGLRIAWGKSYIWLPKSLLEKKIPARFLHSLLKQILHFMHFLKRWSRPRLGWATRKISMRILNGCMISLVGILLAVSPPVPLVSLLAFFALFCLGIGLLNDDGLYILFGYVEALAYLTTVFCLYHYDVISKFWESI